tara:strand:+ start:399 stop:605 length:207 start_codon:yes stop_codon:yes gene_type:complete
MAITIITEHKLIKIVEGDNQRILTPSDDVSKENEEIKSLANANWTQEIKNNWKLVMDNPHTLNSIYQE